MSRSRPREIFLRWLKFSTVGVGGVGVQLAMLTLLVGQLDLHYLGATALAVETAILHNFFWHERWTFRDRGLGSGGRRLGRLLRFNVASGTLSIVGNVGFMTLFVGHLGLHYLVGNILSIASCAIVNFIVNDRFVFLAMRQGPVPAE